MAEPRLMKHLCSGGNYMIDDLKWIVLLIIGGVASTFFCRALSVILGFNIGFHGLVGTF